jgi:hypothetical protein
MIRGAHLADKKRRRCTRKKERKCKKEREREKKRRKDELVSTTWLLCIV